VGAEPNVVGALRDDGTQGLMIMVLPKVDLVGCVPSSTGHVVAQRDGAFDANSSVHDAIWLDGADEIAVLSGPNSELVTLSVKGHGVETSFRYPEVTYHEPNPRRVFAFDPVRHRLWVSVAGRLLAYDRSEYGLIPTEFTPSCPAESIALVW